MKLSPTKYIFGIAAERFLEFMITYRDIEANLEKIQALMNMRHPVSKKEIQQLTGRMAALSQFISKSTEWYLPFFRILRKINDSNLMKEYRLTFDNLKKFLVFTPLLSKSELGEELYLYLAAS